MLSENLGQEGYRLLFPLYPLNPLFLISKQEIKKKSLPYFRKVSSYIL